MSIENPRQLYIFVCLIHGSETHQLSPGVFYRCQYLFFPNTCFYIQVSLIRYFSIRRGRREFTNLPTQLIFRFLSLWKEGEFNEESK